MLTDPNDPILLAKKLGVRGDATRIAPQPKRTPQAEKFNWDVFLNSPVAMGVGMLAEPVDMAMGAKAAYDEYQKGNPKTAAAIGTAAMLPLVPASIGKTSVNYISRLARGLKDMTETVGAAAPTAAADIATWIKRAQQGTRSPALAEIRAAKEAVKEIHGNPNKKLGLDEAIDIAEKSAPTNMLKTTERGLPQYRQGSQLTGFYHPQTEARKKTALLTQYADNMDAPDVPGYTSPHWDDRNVHGWVKTFPTGPGHAPVMNVSEVQTDAIEQLAEAGGPRKILTPSEADIEKAIQDGATWTGELDDVHGRLQRMASLRSRLDFLSTFLRGVIDKGYTPDQYIESLTRELDQIRRAVPAEMLPPLPDPKDVLTNPYRVIEQLSQAHDAAIANRSKLMARARALNEKISGATAIASATPGQRVVFPNEDTPFMTPFLSGEQGASTWAAPIVGGLLAKTADEDALALRIVDAQNRMSAAGLTENSARKIYDKAVPGLVDDFLGFLGIGEDVSRRLIYPSQEAFDQFMMYGGDPGKLREWGFMRGLLADAIGKTGGVPGLPAGR